MTAWVSAADTLLGRALLRVLHAEGIPARVVAPATAPASAPRGQTWETAVDAAAAARDCAVAFLTGADEATEAAARACANLRLIGTGPGAPDARSNVVRFGDPVGAGDRLPSATGRLMLDVLAGRPLPWTDRWLTLVDVDDAARAMVAVWRKTAPGGEVRLGGHAVRLSAFARLVAEIGGVRPPWRPLPIQAGPEPPAGDAAARAALEWQPGPLRPALERAIVWFRAHGVLDETKPGAR